MAGCGVDAQLAAIVGGAGEELVDEFVRQLVGGDLRRHVRVRPVGLFHVGPVAAHAQRHPAAQVDGVDGARINVVAQRGDVVAQAAALARAVGSEEESGQEVRSVLLSRGDTVQVALHRGREVVVDQVRQVLLEQARHGERQPRGHQVLAAVRHVPAVPDRLDGGRVGGGTADTELLHGLDQRGLRVAARGLGLVAVGGGLGQRRGVALGNVRQGLLRIILFRVVTPLVAALLVGQAEARGGDDRARGRGQHVVTLPVNLDAGEHADRRRVAESVGHLRGDRALPDQVVQGQLLLRQGTRHLARRAEVVAGGTDRLVRLLRALRRGAVQARGLGHGLAPIKLGGLLTSRVNRLAGQGRRVGTHVGDVTRLVEGLGGAHRRGGVPVQLARRLLLEGRRREGGSRAAAVGLAGHRVDNRGRGALQRAGVGAGRGLVQMQDAGLGGLRAQLALLAEVGAGRDGVAVHRGDARAEGLARRREGRVDRPVLGTHVRHTVAFLGDHEARSHRLHAAGRQGRADLAPQEGRDLVAVEAVEDAAGLLRVHEVGVQIARVLQGALDRFLRDFVKNHAAHGNLRLQDLQEVPRDSLTLAVLISCQEEFVGLLEELLEFGDLFLLIRVHHVVRLEALVHVDSEATEWPLLHILGQLGGLREVTDVADGSGYVVVGTQVSLNGGGLRRRLHDHELRR